MTAEEYALENMQGCDMQEIESDLIGFARIKCEELLKITAEKARVYQSEGGYENWLTTLWDKNNIF